MSIEVVKVVKVVEAVANAMGKIFFKKLPSYKLAGLLAVALFLPAVFAEGVVEKTGLAEAQINQKITLIEKRITTIKANQKAISEKHTEIQDELKNLRIWINRRR